MRLNPAPTETVTQHDEDRPRKQLILRIASPCIVTAILYR